MNHGPFAYKASALPLSYEGFYCWYILIMDDFDEDVYLQEVEHERARLALKQRKFRRLSPAMHETLRVNSLRLRERPDIPQEYVESLTPPPKSWWQKLIAFFKK